MDAFILEKYTHCQMVVDHSGIRYRCGGEGYMCKQYQSANPRGLGSCAHKPRVHCESAEAQAEVRRILRLVGGK